MKNKESQQLQRELQKKEHTINTGASDHVFKPKTRGKGKTAESEFSRGGIPKVAPHYKHFFPAAIGFHNLKNARSRLSPRLFI